MDTHDVDLELRSIKTVCDDDPEMAHILEDKLYAETLRSIAKQSCLSPKALAKEALKAQDCDYPRWAG